MPMFSPSELEAGGEGQAARFGNKNAPRLLYGNMSRFGMVKGSIAARRANAEAAAAAKVHAPQNETTEHASTLTSSKSSLLAARAATNAAAIGDAPEANPSETTQLDDEREDKFPEGEDNREKSRREEEEETDRLLGPMGSFYELPKVASAADLIRTASHDKSSHSVSQARGLRQANVPTAYSAIVNTGYYRPSDRIGRLYTSTAASLTSASAQSVAKAAATLAVAAGAPAGSGSSGSGGGAGGGGGKARNNGGLGKLVTAPFAAESREILHTLALQPASSREALATALSLGAASSTAVVERPGEEGGEGNQSPSPTGAGASLEAFGSRSPGSPGRPKKVIVIDSDQHTRTQRREMRSPPRGRRILEVAPSSGGVGPSGDGDSGAAPSSGEAPTAPDRGGGYAVKDFRSWNPAILGGVEGGGGGRGGSNSQHAVLGGSSGRSSSAAGGGNGEVGAGGDTVKAMSEAERQNMSIDRYWATVEDRMLNGSPNALGAGAKSSLLDLPPERVDGITSRLAFELRFIPGIELGAYQAYVEAAVNSMLQDVQVGHSVSVARAVVDYELKDPEGRRALGIERGHLTAGPRWYQCQEYLIPEWRVLRQTGVSRARVRRSALALKRRLCSVETVMVGLEKLWHSGVVPGDWDTAAFGGSGDVVGGTIKPESCNRCGRHGRHDEVNLQILQHILSPRMPGSRKIVTRTYSGVYLRKKRGRLVADAKIPPLDD